MKHLTFLTRCWEQWNLARCCYSVTFEAISKSQFFQCCSFYLFFIDWLRCSGHTVPLYQTHQEIHRFFSLFSPAGSWLVLHGAATAATGREMFTSVPSQAPGTAATNSISKVMFDLLSLDLCPLLLNITITDIARYYVYRAVSIL